MFEGPEILSQEVRDSIANLLINTARRIQRSHNVPIKFHYKQNRPVDMTGSIPTYAGNETFECTLEFVRPIGEEIVRNSALNPEEEETHEKSGKS